MSGTEGAVLVLNAGSSSLKYQLVHPDTGDVRADGIVERIGEELSSITHEQGDEVILSLIHIF